MLGGETSRAFLGGPIGVMLSHQFFFLDLAARLGGRTGRPSVSDLLRLIRVPGGPDPAGQSVCGGLREPMPYQLHHGVACNAVASRIYIIPPVLSPSIFYSSCRIALIRRRCSEFRPSGAHGPRSFETNLICIPVFSTQPSTFLD